MVATFLVLNIQAGTHDRETLQLELDTHFFLHIKNAVRCIWLSLKTHTVQTWHFLKADSRVSPPFFTSECKALAVPQSGSSFLLSKHATIDVNVQRAQGRNIKGEGGRERFTQGSCVIWPHFKMDLWGCREGRGVPFTATLSSLPPKWQDGRVHTKAEWDVCLETIHREMKEPWWSHGAKTQQLHLWIMGESIFPKKKKKHKIQIWFWGQRILFDIMTWCNMDNLSIPTQRTSLVHDII